MKIRPRRVRRLLLLAVALGLAPLVLAAGWTLARSAGRMHTVPRAVDAPVAIVFGAQLAPGGTTPMPFLAGRLDTAVELYRAGKVRAVLVSGDAAGGSGNETTVMARYLVTAGVPADRVVEDGFGLDSYDTCRRAHDVYGVRRALLVSQSFHLPRAISVCRGLGVDAHGVGAHCPDCRRTTLAANTLREVPANLKAAWELLRHRPAAVSSAPDDALTRAAS